MSAYLTFHLGNNLYIHFFIKRKTKNRKKEKKVNDLKRVIYQDEAE